MIHTNLLLYFVVLAGIQVIPPNNQPLAFPEDAASAVQTHAMSGFNSLTGTAFPLATTFALPLVSNRHNMLMGTIKANVRMEIHLEGKSLFC